MNSTSNSNSTDKLTIKNFSVSYAVPYYRAESLREHFISFLTSPFRYFFTDIDRMLVLDNISLSLKDGERLGILGNNGAGKTTLAKYISGQYGHYPQIKTNGTVKGIFDTDVVILPELSGRENLKIVAYFLYNDLPTKDIEKIISESADFSELGKFLDTPFKLYSKGMKSRLLLSVIAARPSDILILDEVYNGADHFFSDKITKKIKEVIIKSGAVIFISHSQDTIREVCNRVIVLNNKKIVFDGSPADGIAFYEEHCKTTKITNS